MSGLSGSTSLPMVMAFHAVHQERLEHSADHRLLERLQAEHGGERWAVDVAIQDADRLAAASEADRKIDGNGGLSDAALAGTDSDDVLDARECRGGPLGGWAAGADTADRTVAGRCGWW
jgi:hypothetical protein